MALAMAGLGYDDGNGGAVLIAAEVPRSFPARSNQPPRAETPFRLPGHDFTGDVGFQIF